MPRVPYTGVPEVRSTEQGPGGISPAAPAAAFGGASGQATERAGAVLEKSGDEIFARAIALQTLHNQTEAQEASNQYMIQAGKLHAEYGALQGKDAVDGFDGYAASLDALQKKIGAGLSNDTARRIFDTESRSTLSRSIFNGASHAATMGKQWSIGTAQARLDLFAKGASDIPTDEVGFQDYLNQTRETARNLAAQKGLPEGSPQEEVLVQQAESRLRLQRVIGLSRLKPFEASTLLDSYKGGMTESDWLKADATVRSSARAVGSANIANDIYDAGKDKKTLVQMEEEAKTKAIELAPNDPLLAQHAVSALRSQWNQVKHAQQTEINTDRQTLYRAIGAGAKNEQELRADPEVAAAIDRLVQNDPKTANAVPKMINRQRDVDNEENYNRLVGLAYRSRDAFLNINPYEESLSDTQRNKILVLQQKMIHTPLDDPHTRGALRAIQDSWGQTLTELGIDKRANDPENWDKFVGALRESLSAWSDTHKRRPTTDEITGPIAKNLFRGIQEPAWFGLTTRNVEFFKRQIPQEQVEGIKSEYTKQGLPEPNDEEVRRVYMRSVFQNLYGKK